ncbi:MAG: hypothetical protein ACOCZK_05130 [Planctomycetota bacterium]
MPAFVHWPGVVPAGKQCAVPGSTLDQLPTVYYYLGLDLPDRPIDGISLAPVLAGEQRRRGGRIPFRYLNHRETMFGSPTIALIGDEEKFAINLAEEDPDEELFDPIADPWEHHDLHAGQPERCARLRAELAGFSTPAAAATLGSEGWTCTSLFRCGGMDIHLLVQEREPRPFRRYERHNEPAEGLSMQSG